MNKKVIAVLFGGQSSEHEVSCVSATTIISNINQELYEIIIIGITKEGKWIKVDSIKDITSGQWIHGTTRAILSPDAKHRGILLLENGKCDLKQIDVVFPALHGKRGEDGTVQGLLELCEIPYVGCGVVSSAVSMDKLFTKIIVDTLNIPQAKYVPVYKKELEDMEGIIHRIEQSLSYPVFIKPSNSGSSRGVSKAYNKEEAENGVKEAFLHDSKILVEETIIGREIECAVLGGSLAKASGVGEIIAAADFYDYDAKYNNEDSKTILSPDLPHDVTETLRKYSVEIFKAVDGYGLARVDFFVVDNKKVVFNEINTMPGFTGISMYPMLWEAKGIGKAQLVEKLIQLALSRVSVTGGRGDV